MSKQKQTPSPEEKRLIKRAWIVFSIILIGSLIAEIAIHPHDHFPLQDLPWFHAFFGFIGCAAIVIISKWIGYLLKRPEGYYDEQ